jgi:isocitrate dehydrogenase kinase/phosphatase
MDNYVKISHKANNWFEQHLFNCQKAKKQHEERVAYYNEQIATTEEFLKNLIVAEGGNYWHWGNELLS